MAAQQLTRGQRGAATRRRNIEIAAAEAAAEAANAGEGGTAAGGDAGAARTLQEQQVEDARLAAEQTRVFEADRYQRQAAFEEERNRVQLELLRGGAANNGAANGAGLSPNPTAGELLSPADKLAITLFPSYDQRQLYAIANNTFAPENLPFLVDLTAEAHGGDVEFRLNQATGTFTQHKIIGPLKKFGADARIWSRGFLIWLSVWYALNKDKFDAKLLVTILQFHNRIVQLDQTYLWQEAVLKVAIIHHRIALQQAEQFTPEQWKLTESQIDELCISRDVNC